MRIHLNLLTILLIGALSPSSYAFPELPFCPAGGPPGWLNYFNYKRDQNNWRRYTRPSPVAYGAGQYPVYYAPVYAPPYRKYYYSTPVHNGLQPYLLR